MWQSVCSALHCATICVPVGRLAQIGLLPRLRYSTYIIHEITDSVTSPVRIKHFRFYATMGDVVSRSRTLESYSCEHRHNNSRAVQLYGHSNLPNTPAWIFIVAMMRRYLQSHCSSEWCTSLMLNGNTFIQENESFYHSSPLFFTMHLLQHALPACQSRYSQCTYQ